MSIFSNIKNKYHTKKQRYLNQSEIVKNEIKTGLEVLSQVDKGFNYKKWYTVICILFIIPEIFISQFLYSAYSYVYIQISEILIFFTFFMLLFLTIRLFRIIGRIQAQTVNHKD